jgi:hypothetical protein
MTNYVATIMDLVPNAKISYTGTAIDYDDINWMDEREKPTREACDERWVTLEVELINTRMERARSEAYQNEADPIFFSWQRGEDTEASWLAKVAEIRTRYPYTQ